MIGALLAGFPTVGLTTAVAAEAMGIALLLGLLAGLVPATIAYRSRITETLRTV
jgi:hypothetical protein